LREIQEVLAEHEAVAGRLYHHKNSFPAAANRFQATVDAFPLYSAADELLWKLGDSYAHMGPRFADKSAAAYARIVKDYPLSPYVDEAKSKLEQMEKPIPEADPVAYARMKYEMENRKKAGVLSKTLGVFSKSPDVRMAAKSGMPSMEGLRPTTPASVPVLASAGTGVTADVSVQTVNDSSTLDKSPDARANPPAPAGSAPAATTPDGTAPAATTPDKPQDAAASAAKADDTTTTNKKSKKKKKKSAATK